MVSELSLQPGATVTEGVDICRVDRTTCADAAALAMIVDAATLARAEGFGEIRVFGSISDEIDPATCKVEDIADETLTVVIRKAREDGWCYFLTQAGFAASLDDELVRKPLAVWVATPFAPFVSMSTAFSPWDGTRNPPLLAVAPERPRKLVRDLTHGRTPLDVAPWLLTERPTETSHIFEIWCTAAVTRLAFVLASEIRTVEDENSVVLKGPRSTPLPVALPAAAFAGRIIDAMTEAATWIYAVQREAEARFQFLNYQLSMDWREGRSWPEGLLETLPQGLVSAREAYAFHLQDQGKDALKTLGDLRKSLQEEVARAQSATRDLLSSLWRDLGIAGVVLALKSPTAPQIAGAETLRWVTLATSVLLIVSLAITVFANYRFNLLADQGRSEWRRKIYAFVSDPDWERLVDKPIKKGRFVYQIALPVVVVLYGVSALYLFSVAEPDIALREKVHVGQMINAGAGRLVHWRESFNP